MNRYRISKIEGFCNRGNALLRPKFKCITLLTKYVFYCTFSHRSFTFILAKSYSQKMLVLCVFGYSDKDSSFSFVTENNTKKG